MPSHPTFQAEIEAALAHHAAGRLDHAEAAYRLVLTQQPAHAPALHLLGLIAQQRGDSEAAVRLVTQAIQSSPASPDFHANLGLIYYRMNRMGEAAAALAEAVRLNPDHADALNNLGSTLQALGRNDEAVSYFRAALAVRPDFPLAMRNLAGTLLQLRRANEAAAAYRALADLVPEDAAVHLQLANLLLATGQAAEAATHFRQVLALAPTNFEAHANLGNALRALGQMEAAVASYAEAVRLRPDMGECHLNLASGLLTVGLVEQALAESQTAIRLNPDLDEAYTTRLLALHYRLHPPQDVLDAHRDWARVRTVHLSPACPPELPSAPAVSPGRLRVGLLSPDFFDHPVAYFVEPLLAAHDRQRLEITCYASVAFPDAVTDRLRSQADRWHDVSALSHEEVAGLITADRIDILLDLAGHTAGSRLPVLARQPAPVQVSYLGYPGTTGLPQIAYRLTDGHADPPGLTEGQYTETLVRLPRTLACYAPPPSAPPVAEQPALQPRSAGRVTFASFSSLTKIAPQTIDLWSRALRAVPDSCLVIMARGAEGLEFGRRIRAAFARVGIDPSRLALRPSAAIEHYLAFHRQVDLVLDTFPFNGHTTLCHALWMGVPVVTLAGTRFASRLGLSVLTNAGLPQLVADTPEQFGQITAGVAHDLAGLADLRRGLRQRLGQSSLMDRRQFAQDFLETACLLSSKRTLTIRGETT